MAQIWDLLNIAVYSVYAEADLASYKPVIVLIDEHNRARDL
jgi:aspartate 1-decarboxylase